jgi:hypothetical protein
MSSTLKFIMALCGAALTPLPALCQETTAYKSEVNVEGFLPIVKSTTANGVQQSTSLNGDVLAGYRFFFGRTMALRSAMATRVAQKRIM